MTKHSSIIGTIILLTAISTQVSADSLLQSIQQDYQDRLGDMFIDFHANPELSTAEYRTAKKLANALGSSGFKVTEGVGGTGVVAVLKNKGFA